MATETIIIRFRSDGTRVVERDIDRIGRQSQRTENSVGFLKRALLGFATIATVRAIGRTVDSFTNLQNRLRLVTEGQENLNQVTQQLLQISNQTRSSLETNAELFNRLSLSTKDLNVSQSELLQITRSLNQAVILAGVSSETASAGLIQLSQGLGSGALQGDELRSVLEALPPVADVIAKSLGVTRTELRKLGSEGKITSEVILRAFQESREELDQRFGKTVPTLGQSFTVLRNSLTNLLGTLNETTGVTRGLSAALLGLSDTLDLVANNSRTLFNILLIGREETIERLAEVLERQETTARQLRLSQREEREARERSKESAQAQTDVLERLNRELAIERDLVDEVSANRRVLTEFLKIEQDLKKGGVDLRARENAELQATIAAQVSELDQLRRRAELLEEIRGPQERRLEDLRILKGLLADGAINQREFNNAVEELGVVLADLRPEAVFDSIGNSVQSIASGFSDLGEQIGPAIEDLAQRLGAVTHEITRAAQETERENAVNTLKDEILENIKEKEEERRARLLAVNELLAAGNLTQAETNALLSQFGIRIEETKTFLESLEESFTRINLSAATLGSQIGNTLVSGIGRASDALADFALTGFRDIESLREAAGRLLADLAKQILQVIIQTLILKAIQASLGGAGGGATGAVLGTITGAGGTRGVVGDIGAARQAGGPVDPNRSFLVGERGPELFRPTRRGNIEPIAPAAAPEFSVQIVNVQSQEEAISFLDSPEAKQKILNTVRTNGEALR